MSAILSADDLNDFISPGVACIKPIETLPPTAENDSSNPYEVTTEDKVAAANPAPAQISLTDCLACSGCVTSAEAVLVSLQSHNEVLSTLDAYPSLPPPWMNRRMDSPQGLSANLIQTTNGPLDGKIFVASVSPQVRASLAATFGVTTQEAGNMITHMLCGQNGLASTGQLGSSFLWTIDTDRLRDMALTLAADEVLTTNSIANQPKKPTLTSACPGWICYAEKTHPYVLPHLSRLKSPQALAGTLVKSILAKERNVKPDQVWHLALMPCFDKKLEASRAELMSGIWDEEFSAGQGKTGIRDVDCVITARELLQMAATRGIDFASLPRTPLDRSEQVAFPNAEINAFLFSPDKANSAAKRTFGSSENTTSAGTSDGYLWHIMRTAQARHPGSRINITRGRNADVSEYSLHHNGETVFKAARYYGFRNIQNLVRKLKPAKVSRLPGAKPGGVRRPGSSAVSQKSGSAEYDYVEVMACPGGCTNGGGQIRAGEVDAIREEGVKAVNGEMKRVGAVEQRAWLGVVDEAYFSASDSSDDDEARNKSEETQDQGNQGEPTVSIPIEDDPSRSTPFTDDSVDGTSPTYIHSIISEWSSKTGVEADKLIYTTYREVESDVGKKKSDVERVAGLASSIGGGW